MKTEKKRTMERGDRGNGEGEEVWGGGWKKREETDMALRQMAVYEGKS